MQKTTSLNGLEHCLIVFPNWIGDAVMAQSLVITLKQTYPDLHIDALATPWIAEVVRAMPEINHCHVTRLEHGKLQLVKRWKIAKMLKPQAYDLAILLPNSLKSALIPWFAKIPIRLGHLGEKRYGLLTHPLLPDLSPAANTMIGFYRAILSILGLPTALTADNRPRLKLSSHDKNQPKDQTITSFLPPQSLAPIILAPGAEYGPAKQWSTTQAALFLKKCADEFPNRPLLLVGSAKDVEIANRIEQQFSEVFISHGSIPSPLHNLCGKTNLTQAMTLLRAAMGVVANDSGLLHLASALNVPCIGLYGSTSPNWAPPVGDFSDAIYLNLPCSPCKSRVCPLEHHHCMEHLSADLVWSHFLSVLEQQRANTSKAN